MVTPAIKTKQPTAPTKAGTSTSGSVDDGLALSQPPSARGAKDSHNRHKSSSESSIASSNDGSTGYPSSDYSSD